MPNYLDKDGLLYFWQKIKSVFAQKTELPTKTSDLTNDSNFAADASYVHTDNNYTTSEKNKLSGIAAGAEVNQNAFSTVSVDGINVSATTSTDTLGIIPGSNIIMTPSSSNKTLRIEATDTTYSNATTSTAGLMSASDKIKLNNIASGAQVNVQVDWDVTDTTSDAYIKNKPNIPAGVVVDTAMSGSSENAVQNKVIYNFVNSSIASAVSGLYKYKGSVATASLLPSSGQETGDVYNIEAASVYGGPGMNVAWDGSAWDPLGEIFSITSVTNAEIDTIVAS